MVTPLSELLPEVPDKYEPKNTDEFGTFDRAMTKLLAVPADELQRKIKKHKKRKKCGQSFFLVLFVL